MPFLEWDDFEEDSGQETVVITVSGPRAPTCSLDNVQTAIASLVGPPPGHQWPIYRLMEPGRYYMDVSPDMASRLNKQTVQLKDKPFKLEFLKLKNERLNMRLLWVPPNVKLGAIQKIVSEYLVLEPSMVEVSRAPDRLDMARVDVAIPRDYPLKGIPHYIPISTRDGKTALWFVCMLGRRQKCFFCSSSEHWPGVCPRKAGLDRGAGLGVGRAAPPPPVQQEEPQPSYAEAAKTALLRTPSPSRAPAETPGDPPLTQEEERGNTPPTPLLPVTPKKKKHNPKFKSAPNSPIKKAPIAVDSPSKRRRILARELDIDRPPSPDLNMPIF